MTVLVTGATGFVGSAIVRRLLRDGSSVRVIARPQSDRRNLDGLDLDIVEADLNDPATLRQAVAGCRSVYHAAADYRLWVRDPQSMYRTNVDGTIALMQAATDAGVDRIVYTSSVATLGIPKDGGPGDEETPVSLDDMVGPYKRSKFLAEDAVRRLVGEQGLPAVIVNPSAPVGPHDIKPTPTGRLIADAAAGRIPAFVDTGLNIVHVDDVADGHVLAHDRGRPGDRYVLGCQDMTLRQILTTVAGAVGRPPPRLRLPHCAALPIAYVSEAWARVTGGEPRATVDGVRLARKHMFFSSAKAQRELGYRPRPADEALSDAAQWFLQAGI